MNKERLKKWAGLGVIALGILLSVFLRLKQNKTPYVNTTFHMDTYVSYNLYGAKGEQVFRQVEERILELEEIFNLYDPQSQLNELNNHAGQGEQELSRELYTVLLAAKQGYEESDGWFDPTVGVLTRLWGFGTEHPHVPTEAERTEALAFVNGSSLQLRAEDEHYYASLAEGQRVDLGGIAKGYILSQIRELLREAMLPRAVVSLGGNVLLVGKEETEVSIRRPVAEAMDGVLRLRLSDVTISTSGTYERFFEENGVVYSHIFSPKTGEALSGGELVSVCVVMEDPLQADLWSTAYFLQGADSIEAAMVEGRLDGLMIFQDGEIVISPSLSSRVVEGSLAEGFTLREAGGDHEA